MQGLYESVLLQKKGCLSYMKSITREEAIEKLEKTGLGDHFIQQIVDDLFPPAWTPKVGQAYMFRCPPDRGRGWEITIRSNSKPMSCDVERRPLNTKEITGDEE